MSQKALTLSFLVSRETVLPLKKCCRYSKRKQTFQPKRSWIVCFASTSLTTWRGKSTWGKNQVEYGAFKWTFKCQTGGVHSHWNVSVGACIRQLQTTTSHARVSSPSKVFADEVKRSRERKKKKNYFGNISFRILPCWLSLSPVFNDMLQNFVSWMPWEEEGGERRRRGREKKLVQPPF